MFFWARVSSFSVFFLVLEFKLLLGDKFTIIGTGDGVEMMAIYFLFQYGFIINNGFGDGDLCFVFLFLDL